MARAGRAFVVCGLAILVGPLVGCGPEARVAPAPFTTALQSDDVVASLTVTLAVGDRGAALDEPVVLDLGLGYPLWLHPLGREPGEALPFGAVAQTSTAGASLQPGEQATFTFGVAAPAGQDALLATPHLLADTRVGDIRRVGLASERAADWILGDFEVRVNGTLLLADRAVPWAPDAAQQALTARIAAIDGELAALRTRYEALAAPQGADRAAAKALEVQARPLLGERTAKAAQVLVDARSAAATRTVDLERQSALRTIDASSTSGETRADDEARRIDARLAGTHPWYVADSFRPGWIPAGLVQTASVTLETRAHAGADTSNPAYVRIGGHKYGLNAQYQSLSAAAGAQTFELDLDAGPLASTDLGRFALGLLGAPERREAVPDRWHAQRLLVTADGTVVYDSDDDARDRRSLDAVRLIPPAHRDADGAVVANVRSVREVYLWEAGRGAGLDSSGTSATPLPAASDPTYPQPEAGLAPDAGTGSGTNGWPNTAFPPLPGEQTPSYGGSWGGSSQGGSGYASGPAHGGGSGPWLQGGFQWGPGGGSLWGGFGQKQGGKLPWGSGSGSQGPFGGGSSSGKQGGATTTGKPFQMQDVWISSGWKLNEPFTVEWKVSGDTSGIRHFLVSLRVVRPDQAQGIFKDAAKKPVKVAVGQRSCTVLVDPNFKPAQPYYYLAPYVTAVTKKGSKQSPQSHLGIGPARAVFPAIANTKIQPIPKDFSWKGGGPKPLSVGTLEKPLKHRTACFVAGAATPDAIQIGIAKPASHVAVRPQHGDRVTVRYEIPSFTGRQQLIGHVGFMGATIAADKAEVEMACTLVGQGKTYAYPVWKGKASTGGSLTFVQQPLDAADLGVALTKAQVRITFDQGGALDPRCVPGVYGLRLFPVKGTASPTTTVNADLVIDPTATWLVPGDRRDGITTGPAHQLCVAVRNNGPDAIPAALLREIKVVVKYYVGQRGEAFQASHGKIVQCGPHRVTDLRELGSSGTWSGSLAKGEVLRLVPTPASGHPDLDVDGNLKSVKQLTINQANAHKLFMVWADIVTSGAPALKESHPNNVWTHTYQPPLIIGKGPLDYEVLLFEKPDYQGTREGYEYDPDTQRQRLVWDLRKEPGKQDMFWKTGSFMVGRMVDLATGEDHHFFSETYNTPLLHTEAGNTSGAFQPKLWHPTGSLIISPKQNDGPIGVSVGCNEEWTLGVSQDDACSMFIPLPEKRSETVVMIPSLLPSLNDEIDMIVAWRSVADASSGPKAWVKVTLYEDGNGGGSRRTLAPPFNSHWTSDFNGRFKGNFYKLRLWTWDGLIAGQAATGVDNEVTSLKLELKGASGY